MSQTNSYTSTGVKFIKKLLKNPLLLLYPKPISLQLALTERCNLKCSFCSVAGRDNKYEFDFEELCNATNEFAKLGIKTIEITGGGEPLLYKGFANYIRWLKSHYPKIKLGLITNGTLLNSFHKSILDSFSWIRISINSIDYYGDIFIPKINGTLGFSYCFGSDSSYENLEKVKSLAIQNFVEYVRVVPNCCCSLEELYAQHSIIEPMVESLGSPLFYQKKQFCRPSKCYWGYYKPFLYCDGYIYPCSSTVLNDDADKKFNEIYRLYHWTEMDNMYSKMVSLIDTNFCNHCVFTAQNEIIESLISIDKQEDFI